MMSLCCIIIIINQERKELHSLNSVGKSAWIIHSFIHSFIHYLSVLSALLNKIFPSFII